MTEDAAQRVRMDFEDLVAEYRSVGIGALIFSEITHLVKAVVRSYDPIVYGHVWRWDEGVDDLLQEFCLEVLIDRGQLDYAMVTAADLQHFRRLLARQLRHLLARRRRRTIVDNLLGRSRRLVSSPPFRLLTERHGWSYTLENKPVKGGPTPVAELRRLAAELADVPKVAGNPSQRAPMVYTTASLRELLWKAADRLQKTVSVHDLDAIFKLQLTCWLPRLLENDEDSGGRPATAELSAEERAMVDEAVQSVIERCADAERKVLRLKLAGSSDSEVSRRLGISRPTVAKRKQQVLSLLEDALAHLSDVVRVAVMDRLGVYLEEPEDG